MGDGALDKLREAVQADLRRRGFAETAVRHATLPVNRGDLAGHNVFGIAFEDSFGTTAVWLKIEGGKIAAASFTTDGPDASMACGSVLTELVENKTVNEAGALTAADIDRALGGLPQGELGAARLAARALQNALEQA